MFSDSVLAFRELRRLVLAFLTGPDSRLFRNVDGLEATDEELDELLLAGGSFTLYHLQKLNLLSAQMAAFSELVKVVRFLSDKSLAARERLFAYLNQHQVVNPNGIPARVCSLFSAPSSYAITGMHVPPQAPSFHFSSDLLDQSSSPPSGTSGPSIPSFSWAEIDSLYIEGLAGDATLECVWELEDANPHLRLNEITTRAMCTRLADLIKQRYLSSQSTLMRRLGSRYATVELDRYLEGFEEFLAGQHGSKAHLKRQQEKAAAQARAAQEMAMRGGGGIDLGMHPSFLHSSTGDHPFAYLDPLVAYLSSPSTLLFSSTLPIRSGDVLRLVEMCYDDVELCAWYLRRINDNIERCSRGGSAPWPGVPSSRLADFSALKLAVFQLVQQDDQRKMELAEWMNRTERGRNLVARDSAANAGGSNQSSSASLHGNDQPQLLSMADIEYLYRSTWSAVAHATSGRGSLVHVLSLLPAHLHFSSLSALVQYIVKQQSQHEVQARARGRAKDRANVVAEAGMLAELLPRSHRSLQLTQHHIDALLNAARSQRIDLAVHPLFNLAPTDHPTQTGRYLNAGASAAAHSRVLEGFDPHSLFPALQLHLRFLLRHQAAKKRTFESITDLVKAVEMCARQTDQMVATMHEYLTTPSRRGGGRSIFEPLDRHAKANTFDVDSLSHADMYLLLLLSSAGLSSFLILQRLHSLRSLPPSAQLSFQSLPPCVDAGVDVVNWPVESLEELVQRVGSVWKAKYETKDDGAGKEGEGEEWSKYDEEFQQSSDAFTVGGGAGSNASRGYKPPVFDNVYTSLSASAYTPAEDSEHLIRRRHRPAQQADHSNEDGSQWGPEERIRLYEFLTRPECRLLSIPGAGGSSVDLGAAEEKSSHPSGVSTLPPLSRAMLHSLLSAGGGLQQTLALLRSLESSHRSFPSFSLLLSSVSSAHTTFLRMVENLVFLMRTYKGRRMMRDCLAREGQGGRGEGREKQSAVAPAEEPELELQPSSTEDDTSAPSAFPIELEEHPRGILLSDEAMMECMTSWCLSLLPRLGDQLSVLYYVKELLGMNGSVPTGIQLDFVGLDGLADVLHMLYQRDLARLASSSGSIALAFDPRSRVVVELTQEEEAWLEEEPNVRAPAGATSRPMTASHRLTVSNQPGASSTLLVDHTSFDPLTIPSSTTLGYSNGQDEDGFSPLHTNHGLSSEDAREFFTAFSPPGHATRMRLGAHAHAAADAEMDHHDPFFVQLVRQQEAEAEEILKYLKSGRSRLLDPRTPVGAASSAASPRSSVVSSMQEGNIGSRTVTLATSSLVATLQRSGGLGPLTLSKPRNQLARYLHLILRSTSQWMIENERKAAANGGAGAGSADAAPGMAEIQPSEGGFNSLDVVPSVHHDSSSPSALLSSYDVPSLFSDFTNSPTLHLLQQLDIMETRFVASTTNARAGENGLMSPFSPASSDDQQHQENLHRLQHFGFSEVDGQEEQVDAPNVSLLAQVIANRKAKAVAIHGTVFRKLTPEDQVKGALGPVAPVAHDPSIHPPAARDAPPSLSAYLADVALLDHPSCRWPLILPEDPPSQDHVEMVPSGTIPSYMVPKKVEEDYVDGSDIKPDPISKQDQPPSFKQSALQLAKVLLKFDDTLERRVEAVVSLDTPLLELISTLQNLQPQLGLVNTLLALSAKRDGPPLINRQQFLAPSPASVPHAAALLQQQQQQQLSDDFELTTVADLPFPERPHPSFLNVLHPLLSSLHAHLVSTQSFYTRTIPAWFQEIHPLMQWMKEFYPALYEALRAAQYVGTSAPQASTAHHPLHPHLMLMLPLLQGSFHLLAEYLTRRSAQQLHPALFRLEAYSANLAQFIIQLHPLSTWLHRLLLAPASALSPEMRRMREESLEEYRAFILNLPGFLAKLAPFVTAMQTHLRAYLPFSSALQTQYATFVRPLLLPILPLLLPIEQDKGISYAPLTLEQEEELELQA
jgi:hypothetical protein